MTPIEQLRELLNHYMPKQALGLPHPGLQKSLALLDQLAQERQELVALVARTNYLLKSNLMTITMGLHKDIELWLTEHEKGEEKP